MLVVDKEVLDELVALTGNHVRECQCLPCQVLAEVPGALEQFMKFRESKQDPSILDPLIQVDNEGKGAFGDE